jgi:hypothetical protein
MKRSFWGHHMRLLGYKNPILDTAAQGIEARSASKGREQQLIDSHGGVGDSKVGNSIRGVAKANLFGRLYHDMSNKYFGPLSKYSGYQGVYEY